jgi:hypothetical protein
MSLLSRCRVAAEWWVAAFSSVSVVARSGFTVGGRSKCPNPLGGNKSPGYEPSARGCPLLASAQKRGSARLDRPTGYTMPANSVPLAARHLIHVP